jgi:hypothetical protein
VLYDYLVVVQGLEFTCTEYTMYDFVPQNFHDAFWVPGANPDGLGMVVDEAKQVVLESGFWVYVLDFVRDIADFYCRG